MSQIVESAFALVFFIPATLMLAYLLYGFTRTYQADDTGGQLGIEVWLTGAAALIILIATALTMWISG